MTHFKCDSSLKEIANSMRMLIISSDRPKTFLADPEEESSMYHFLEKTYLVDDCQYWFNLMFNCVDCSARLYAGEIAAKAVAQAFYVTYNVVGDKQH
jgi:hypothetical protein